ncbi:MAG: hypothetical protein Q9225_006622 [Loekoesia sp. 1 TL-2023]
MPSFSMNTSRLPLPIKKQNQSTQLPTYRGGVFTSRLERSAKHNNMPPKTRGIIGAGPGEIRIREAAARKKAFERECYDSGDDGAECDYDGDVDEKEMEELLEEMRYLEGGGRKGSKKEGEGGRKKSFAARLLSRG